MSEQAMNPTSIQQLINASSCSGSSGTGYHDVMVRIRHGFWISQSIFIAIQVRRYEKDWWLFNVLGDVSAILVRPSEMDGMWIMMANSNQALPIIDFHSIQVWKDSESDDGKWVDATPEQKMAYADAIYPPFADTPCALLDESVQLSGMKTVLPMSEDDGITKAHPQISSSFQVLLDACQKQTRVYEKNDSNHTRMTIWLDREKACRVLQDGETTMYISDNRQLKEKWASQRSEGGDTRMQI